MLRGFAALSLVSAAIIVSSGFSTSKGALNHIQWGAYVGHGGRDLARFEETVGAPVDLYKRFVSWDQPFPARSAASVKRRGKTLIIHWEPYRRPLDGILAGKWDPYITSFAAQARAYGGKVLLAPMPEMNGNWDPWSGSVGTNTPAKAVDAWRHIRRTFGNVANVDFVWTVNHRSIPNTRANSIEAYYPGREYVDRIGVDGFNWGTPWLSFGAIFDDALRVLKRYRKPIYIMSVGSAAGTRKADWIEDAFLKQVPRHPEIVGWVWFNERKERNWRVDSNRSSLAAFRAVVDQLR